MRLEGLYERERERRRRLGGVYERAGDVLEGVYDRLLRDLDLEREEDDEGDEDGDVEYLRCLRLRLSGPRTVVTAGGGG